MKINFKTLLQGMLVLSVSLMLTSHDAMAQGASRAKKKDTEEAANQIDQKTGEVMAKALEFYNATPPQYAQARAKLGELKMDKLSPYEKSRVEQIYYQMDALEEKFDSARKHIEAAIASGGLTDKEISDMRYYGAQMLVQQEKWKEGAAAIEDWVKTATKPNGSVYYLLGVCYYNLENIDSALTNLRKAMDSSDKPLEAWTSMYASLLLQKERYKEALPIMTSLLNTYSSKKQYWMNVSQIYSNLDDNKNALIVMQLAYDAGMPFEANELQRLADLMAFQEMPYNAGVFMEKAINDKKIQPDQKAWEKLYVMYSNASEFKKAVTALEKAQQLGETGVNFQRMGELYLRLFQWDSAQVALEKALNKGGLRDVPYVEFYVGFCLYNQKKYSEAKTWLEKVPATSTQGKAAKSFIQLINTKIR